MRVARARDRSREGAYTQPFIPLRRGKDIVVRQVCAALALLGVCGHGTIAGLQAPEHDTRPGDWSGLNEAPPCRGNDCAAKWECVSSRAVVAERALPREAVAIVAGGEDCSGWREGR